MKKLSKILAVSVTSLLAITLAACTDGNRGDGGEHSSATIDDVKIALDVVDGNTELSWTPVDGAEFTVYRAMSRFGEYDEMESGITDGEYIDGVRYGYYRVVAKDADGKTLKVFEDIGEEIELFGANTYVLSPDDNKDEVKKLITDTHNRMYAEEFTDRRFCVLLKQGTYDDSIPFNISYYTTVSGLGETPDDVSIKTLRCKNGEVGNACLNFWRGAENLTVRSDTMWAVSQGAYLRSVKIIGNLNFFDNSGYSSGGFFADSYVSGTVSSGTQQQWLSRNCAWNKWQGAVWNMCFAGIENAPIGTYPQDKFTVEQSTTLREKPFLTFDEQNGYSIAVPALRKNAVGLSWSDSNLSSRIERRIPAENIYFARADRDTAATINAALDTGKSVVMTAGVYTLDAPITVKNNGAVVLGLGVATLRSNGGATCLSVDGCSDVSVSGLLLDAGSVKSRNLAAIGSKTNATRDIRLYDMSFRVGGVADAYTGVETALEFRADDSLCDNIWIWRADHGNGPDKSIGVGWTVNDGVTGAEVYGDNVTFYALMAEHFKKHNVVFYGENDKVFFYQSEIAYDVPTQNDFADGERVGYSSLHVDDAVKNFAAAGLGVYSNFHNDNVVLGSAITVPDAAGVKIDHACSVRINGSKGGIQNVVNGFGGAAGAGSSVGERYVVSYSDGVGVQ